MSADDDKPGVSGAAVYAEVKKKGPSSDNNANVYAEVKKSGQKASDEGALYSDVVKPKKGYLITYSRSLHYFSSNI